MNSRSVAGAKPEVQRRVVHGKEKPKALITEVDDGTTTAPAMRLPKYTITQNVTSETSSDSGDARSGIP